MACFLEKYGLEFLKEDEEIVSGFLAYVAKDGRALRSYNGAPYLTHTLGDTEFWIRTEIQGQNLAICAVDTHNSGSCVWEMEFSDVEITSEEDMPYRRTFLFNGSDGKGLLPIQLLNADVLPSMLKGDHVKMQVVALPLYIDYYADEEAYAQAQPADKRGKKWLCATGSLLPLSFLANHAIDKDQQEADYTSDCYVHFSATVTDVFCGRFSLGDKTENTFIRCIADTSFGKLEFVHSLSQIQKEQRKNISRGSVIGGVCILSADVAIDAYKDGIVFDHEHHLHLLRQAFVKGESTRMQSVLAKDAVYMTDSSAEVFQGPQAIVDRFRYVHENCNCKHYAYTAEITEGDVDLPYPVGTRCVLLVAEEESDADDLALVFIDEDDEGKISAITISRDSRYSFRADLPEQESSAEDEFSMPESVSQSMLARAKFHGIIEETLDEAELLNSFSEEEALLQNAQWVWSILHEQSPDISYDIGRNLFGYLFAKSIEQTYLPTQTTVFLREDALAGRIVSALPPAQHAALEEAMSLGGQFYNDLKFFVERKGFPEEKFVDTFREAALLTQRLGQLYADRCLQGAQEE